MKKIIAVANQKGGVGKTTTALNIGAGFRKKGFNVLLIDLDPQANLSTCLMFEPDGKPTISELLSSQVTGNTADIKTAIRNYEKEDIDYIPASLTLSAAEFFLINAFCRETVLRKLLSIDEFDNYDYIIIDCLPSLGILFLNALTASDSILIPVLTQKLALDGLELVLSKCKEIKENINPKLEIEGILFTMTERTIMSRSVEEHIKREYPELALKSYISKSTEASKSSAYQESLVQMGTKLGQQYEAVVDELIERGI